jgi:hypothetical protein
MPLNLQRTPAAVSENESAPAIEAMEISEKGIFIHIEPEDLQLDVFHTIFLSWDLPLNIAALANAAHNYQPT